MNAVRLSHLGLSHRNLVPDCKSKFLTEVSEFFPCKVSPISFLAFLLQKLIIFGSVCHCYFYFCKDTMVVTLHLFFSLD